MKVLQIHGKSTTLIALEVMKCWKNQEREQMSLIKEIKCAFETKRDGRKDALHWTVR